MDLIDFEQKLPDSMCVGVVMEKKPSDHPWADFSYRALGVVASVEVAEKSMRRIYQDNGVEHYLIEGLNLELHRDECESYYHNLMSPQPGCFIVAATPEDSDEMPVPYLVSLSFDEVHAYLEGDEEVYSVGIPPRLYQWVEAYVLSNYVATKKTKRKLKNWHQPEPEKTGSSDTHG